MIGFKNVVFRWGLLSSPFLFGWVFLPKFCYSAPLVYLFIDIYDSLGSSWASSFFIRCNFNYKIALIFKFYDPLDPTGTQTLSPFPLSWQLSIWLFHILSLFFFEIVCFTFFIVFLGCILLTSYLSTPIYRILLSHFSISFILFKTTLAQRIHYSLEIEHIKTPQ